MTTRTFAAATVQDAFRSVRAKLGDRAVILDVRHLGGRVEVVAGQERPRGLRRIMEQGARPVRAEILEDDVDPADLISLQVVPGPGGRDRPFSRALSLLELPPDLAARISHIVGDGPGAFRRLEAHLETSYPIPDPEPDLATGVIAVGFLGGRGVGKSSLVRGLAARAAIQQPGRVVWLEAGFPARPVQPMHDMLAPLGVDHRVANHPYEVEQIADEHHDVSAVLLDLPGIDVHRSGERDALLRYVRASRKAWPSLSLHGTASAMWSAREAQRSLTAQISLGATGAAWTWVDRAGGPGTILATSLRISVPPTFFAGSHDSDHEEARSAGWDEVIEWLMAAAELQEGLKS